MVHHIMATDRLVLYKIYKKKRCTMYKTYIKLIAVG